MVKLGLDPLEVWEYTPKELSFIAEQRQESAKTRIQEILVLAWHTEAFARHKRLPALSQVIKGTANKSSDKSDLILKAMAKEKGVEIK